MTPSSPLLAIATILLVAITASWFFAARNRRRLLARIQSEWGSNTPATHARDSMEAIADLYRSRARTEPDRDGLGDRTWQDLNLDDVFQVIDRTSGTFGQQALYHRLRSTHTPEDLASFEELISRMTTDVPLRQRAQVALSALRDQDGYDVWWIAQPGILDQRPWQVIYPLMTAAMVSLLALSAVWPVALFGLVIGIVLNVIIRGVTARRFAPLVRPFRQVAAVIAAGQSLGFLARNDSNPLLRPLEDDVPKLRRLHGIVQWLGRDPASSGEIAATLIEYLNMFLLVDVNAAYFATGEVGRCSASLFRAAAAVGDVDCAIGVASFRAGTDGWTRPVFVPAGTETTMRDLRHPLVENAVPNSIDLAPPHGILVTGSNMSGKTTFIRTIGVNAILAQSIHTCLASAYQAPALRVRTCIGRSDDLLAGKSYYIVEVEAVLSMVQASKSGVPHLFLFDELFRGTNAVERIAAAEAVLAELLEDASGVTPHLVLAATHDGELVDLLHGTYVACHFGDELGDAGLTFDHRLRVGAATTRNAIALLGLHGAPEAMVTRALARAAVLDRQRASL